MPRLLLRQRRIPLYYDVYKFVSATSAYTVLEDDEVILADTTAAGFTVTLPAISAETNTGRQMHITIKKIDLTANGDVTVATPGAETIDGAASVTLTDRWDTITLVSDGSNWYKLGSTV
jgi:hypothetical protein